jgi:hypothetical protein
MSRSLRTLFLVHATVAAVVGLLLLASPGRFLGLLGWAPIDPITSRLLGAALLALAWGSYRGWRATERIQVAILVELQAAFCLLASAGMLRHLATAAWPWYVWLLFVGFVAFTIAWAYALTMLRR